MKLIRRLLTASLALLLLLGSCARASEDGDYLYMINVGKGDAILIRCQGRFYLIDCGKGGAWDSVEAALNRHGVDALEAVFLTHTDKDHGGGLKKLVKSGMPVKNWYASAYYTCEYNDHPMVKALKKTDAAIQFLKAGDSVDGIFSVISPIVPDGDNDDNNSLVMLFDNGLCRVLLTGDMEGKEERRLLMEGQLPACDVFKVPNHADDDVCLYMDLNALGARHALISTDPYDKPGTPDPALMKRLEQAGMEIWRTDLSKNGIMVTLGEKLNVTTD
ncbi:MAG: MBL fold metallo-hydrolase [Clostridia bacterium]|nr:MBL fold metallo-hydrolase [Clostridia bacterium]